MHNAMLPSKSKGKASDAAHHLPPQQARASAELPWFVKASLSVGAAHDDAEQRADRIAERAIATPRGRGDGPAVRLAGARESGLQGGSPSTVRNALGSSGRPLDAASRAYFEPRFGVDLGSVRVHADEPAAESARAVDAAAFTLGHDVVFAAGRYAPNSREGRLLLAHELAHVLDGDASAHRNVIRRQPAAPSGAPVSHPVADGTASVSVSVGPTMTAEAGLRVVYDQSARKITQQALAMAAEGGSTAEATENAARWATQARNELKAAIRAKGSVVTKALAEARNLRKYGNKIGPTYDELIREGKTPKDIIGSAGEANIKMNRAATSMKLAGKLLIVLSIAIVTWEVVSAPEGTRLRTAAGGVGGLAGAWAGGEVGALGGGKLGGIIGTFIEPGGGTAVGAAIGGIIGGIGGAVAGGFFGKKAGEGLYDYAEELFAPNIDADMKMIDDEQDAAIRGRATAKPH